MICLRSLQLLAILALPYPIAHAQAKAVVLYDPGSEITCIAISTATNCTVPPPPPPTAPLPVQQQIALHVLPGPLLNRYVLHWGSEGVGTAAFPILAGGPVQVLALDLPATVPVKADTGQVATKWTANTILNAVLDPGTSVTPDIDLEHQDEARMVKQSEVRSEIDAFNAVYDKIVSQSNSPPTPPNPPDVPSPPGIPNLLTCEPLSPRSGFHLAQCLEAAYVTPPPVMSRQQFLDLDQQWRRRFEDVQLFAREFNANRIGARLLELESAIRSYNEEVEVLHANVMACEDAYSLVLDMRSNGSSSAAALAAWVQIRARLVAGTSASGTTPASALEREVLADSEIKALRHVDHDDQPDSLSGKHLRKLNKFCRDHETPPDPAPFSNDLAALRGKESYLPLLVKSMNDIQALAVVRLNALYTTTPLGPIETLYNTGFDAKEKSVSYSIGVIDQFTPYTLVGASPAESVSGRSGATTHETITASGAFTVPAP